MLALTDRQLALLMAATATLPASQRVAFLRQFAAQAARGQATTTQETTQHDDANIPAPS
jgi:hypothetical protein